MEHPIEYIMMNSQFIIGTIIYFIIFLTVFSFVPQGLEYEETRAIILVIFMIGAFVLLALTNPHRGYCDIDGNCQELNIDSIE